MKSNELMHYDRKYDTYRGTMGTFFSGSILCFGTNYDANLEIMSYHVLLCQPLHTSRSEERLDNTVQIEMLRTFRLSRSAFIRVHVEVQIG